MSTAGITKSRTHLCNAVSSAAGVESFTHGCRSDEAESGKHELGPSNEFWIPEVDLNVLVHPAKSASV